MALSFDLSPLGRALHAFAHATSPRELAVQLAVAAAAIVAAWLVVHFMHRHVRIDPRWKFGKGNSELVAFPLLALLLVWSCKTVLGAVQEADTAPIEIVIVLLWAFFVIRAAAYILGHVIPEGEFQRVVIRGVMAIAWLGVLLRVTGLMPEVLDLLDEYKVTQQITVLDVLKGALALFLSVTVALWISRVTEARVMAADSMELTSRVVVGKVVRVVTIFVAIFVALPLAGIDVTTLSIFTGAIGVGLGFGLQRIASNYVSGFIVLLDRSLRIGDVIVVDGRRGQVTAIQSRCTVIRGSDGIESIVPNEKLITDTVAHNTLSNPYVAVAVAVTVAYDSDVERACALLVEHANKHKRVLPDPPAAARIRQLTERGVDLELTVWIADPVNGDGDIRGDVLMGVLKAYRTEGIAIPYPQREVRLIATPETPKS